MKKNFRLYAFLALQTLAMIILLKLTLPYDFLQQWFSQKQYLIDHLLVLIYIFVFVILSLNEATLVENGYEKKYSFSNSVLFISLLLTGAKAPIMVAFVSAFIIHFLQIVKSRKLLFPSFIIKLTTDVISASIMSMVFSLLNGVAYPSVNFPVNFFIIIIASFSNYLIKTLFSIQYIFIMQSEYKKSFRKLLFQEYGWIFKYDLWQAIYAVLFYNTVGIFLYNNFGKIPQTNSEQIISQADFVYFLVWLIALCGIMYIPLNGWLQSFKTFILFNKQNVSNVILNMQEGLIVLDKEGTVQTFNQSAFNIFESFYQLQKNEHIENLIKNISLSNSSEDESLLSILNAVKNQRETSKTSLTLNDNNTIKHLEIIVTPETNRFEEITGSVITIEDTTQLKQLIEEKNAQLHTIKTISTELEQKLKELEETQEQLVITEKMAVIGQLVAGVAHEINTPLASIKSNNDLERMLVTRVDPSNPDTIKKFTESIKSMSNVNSMALDRIIEIVKSLKNFARLDESELKEVDIHEGIDSTLAIINTQLTNKRIKISKDYGNIPLIACFPSQLNQVFMNLLVNAIQAIPNEGGIIGIKTWSKNDKVYVSIKDTGEGIKPEYLAKIFDPGFTTKGVGVGTGLGLSISYRIINKHHGKIEAISEVGKGAEFIIELPLSVLEEGDKHE